MKIEDIRIETWNDRSRLGARIVWEDCARAACDVYFETQREFASALSDRPDAFLAACLTPALWAGERRVKCDGEVCPELLDNLRVVRRLFQHWFRLDMAAAAIEAAPRARSLDRATAGRAAFFLSGGIDSLAAWRANRDAVPRTHPLSMSDAIIVYGLEVEEQQPFEYVLEALTSLTRQARLTLVPVSTNLRVLNPDWTFWYQAYMGPALCAVAHAIGHRISNVTVGSDYDAANLAPHGSHPLVEPNFSSGALRVRYHGLTMSRLEKVELVARSPEALRHLRVCNKPERYRPGQLNCGECEKCVRTMLELIAVGALDRTPVFVRNDVTPEVVRALYAPPKVQPFYTELIRPLEAAGRSDLAQAVVQLLAHARGETGLTGRLRKFDRDRLNGSLVSLKRALTSSPVS